jgi:hypothetical protein
MKIGVPIQSIADESKCSQLVREGRVQRLELIPLAGRRLGIIEIAHDFDDVDVVGPMEFEMSCASNYAFGLL